MTILKLFHFIVVIVAAFEIIGIRCYEFKTVQTSDGGVKGVKKTTEYKKVKYFSFRGIPYAEKPTGDLRFKAPKPKKSWRKVLDATEFGSICPQLGELLPSTYPQSEDCLFLNIYVPANATKDEKLPVLFFIFGGGYGEGSGNDDFYGPDFFIEINVILVTFNYRLGIFGFLSLNLPEYSGNMGLKDQQLALKWIYRNIGYFNGDNKKIMIFGQSAGGASVHHHTLSSESRKYFKNAISMSGAASQYWAMSEYNDHLDVAQQIAKEAGQKITDPNELAKFLVSQPTENLVKYGSIWALMTDRTFLVKFTPVIERADAKDAFMTKTIEELYETEHIDVNTLFTYASAEMLMVIVKALPKMFDIDGLNSNFSIKLPFKSLTLSPDSAEYRAINKEIRQFYFGNDTINSSKTAQYVSLLSDVNMCYGIDKAAQLHAIKSHGKTYYARFNVDSKLNIIKRTMAQVQAPGASHCDDLCYVFKLGAGKPFYDEVFKNKTDEQSKRSLKAIDNMTNFFKNFAKLDDNHVSPLCGLNPMNDREYNFVDIHNRGVTTGTNPNRKAMDFWMNIEKRMQKYIKVRRYGKTLRKRDLLLQCLGFNYNSETDEE